MKKVLLATSAFALMAGAASAEISLSGSARMGLIYSDVNGVTTEAFSSRVRIVFTASGETDTGLSFGASMRADQDGGNTSGTANGDSTVFISGAFGKLTMGDVSGAADALVGQTSGVGYGPNDGLQEISFVGTTKTAAYYEYSTGGFTFGLGAGQLSSTSDELNIGVKYSTDTYSVALGWETTDGTAAAPATFTAAPVSPTVYAEDLISLGASAKLGAATLKARVSDSDINGKDTTWSVSVDYTTGATTLTAFYTDFGNTIKTVADDTQHVGIGASYDLGGGATVAGGIVQQLNNVAVDNTYADVGLKFSF
ncbi:MAG: porin [Pseudomonadota bacterium]